MIVGGLVGWVGQRNLWVGWVGQRNLWVGWVGQRNLWVGGLDRGICGLVGEKNKIPMFKILEKNN